MKYHASTTEYNCGIDLHTNVKHNDFEFFLELAVPCRHELIPQPRDCECMFGWYWLSDA